MLARRLTPSRAQLRVPWGRINPGGLQFPFSAAVIPAPSQHRAVRVHRALHDGTPDATHESGALPALRCAAVASGLHCAIVADSATEPDPVHADAGRAGRSYEDAGALRREPLANEPFIAPQAFAHPSARLILEYPTRNTEDKDDAHRQAVPHEYPGAAFLEIVQ